MKKTDADTTAEPRPVDATKVGASSAAAPPPVEAEASAPPAPPVFDDGLEWPSAGGCWVRQADGSLKKEG